MKKKLYFNYFFCIFFVSFFVSEFQIASGQFITKRQKASQNNELSYYLYPLAYSVPGVGSGYGLGGSLFYGDFGTSLLYLDGPWKLTSLLFQDIPLFTRSFTMTLGYVSITDGKFAFYGRGAESKKDPIFKVGLEKTSLLGLQFNYYKWNRQLKIYAGISVNAFKVKSFSSATPKDLKEATDLIKFQYQIIDVFKPIIGRIGVIWDNTDSESDPHKGFRAQYERYTNVGDNSFVDFAIDDFSFSQYIPVFDNDVFTWNIFYSQAASSVKKISKNSAIFYRDPEEIDGCLRSIANKRNSDYEEFVKVQSFMSAEQFCHLNNVVFDSYLRTGVRESVGATTLGGVNRLRSYPLGRFWDTASFFGGFEYRQYLGQSQDKAFDFFIEKGRYNSVQLAYFLDIGGVGPSADKVFEKIKYSAGIGLRLILGSAILRLDTATGAEGHEFIAFLGYPF